jgi:hypothetical protein
MPLEHSTSAPAKSIQADLRQARDEGPSPDFLAEAMANKIKQALASGTASPEGRLTWTTQIAPTCGSCEEATLRRSAAT